MSKTLLYESDHIDIYYDADHQWIYTDWKGYQTVGWVQSGCEQILEYMMACGASKVLNDNTRVVGIWIGAAHWGATNWFPRMQKAGLKHFAWIYSPTRLSQISTDASLDEGTNDVVRTFYSLEEASAWLEKQS